MNSWRSRLPSEIAFWEQWLKEQGGEHFHDNFLARLDPEARLTPLVDEAVSDAHARGRAPVRILEVGCGPLSGMGKRASCGATLDVFYADPLGHHYLAAMHAAGVTPTHGFFSVAGECLVEHFGSNSFDVAYATNALDHTANPLIVLWNMLTVVRPNGRVILEHNWREGQHAGYTDLHQWDLWCEGGEFFIGDSDRQTVNASHWLRSMAQSRAWEQSTSPGQRRFVQAVFNRHSAEP
jgi:SAM-dependent methyltransferase